MMNRLAAFAFAVFLAACTTAPPEGALPDLTFAQVAPVNVNAARVEVIDNYVSPEAAPNVEHLFKTTPARAARMLVEHQVRPAGMGGRTLRVYIEDAGVRRDIQPAAAKPPVATMIAPQVAEIYRGRVALRFELVDDNAPDIVLAHAEVSASRSKNIMHGTTLAARDRAGFDLTEAMMNDLAVTMAQTVGQTFGIGY